MVLIPTQRSSQNIEAGGYFSAFMLSWGAVLPNSLPGESQTHLREKLKEQKGSLEFTVSGFYILSRTDLKGEKKKPHLVRGGAFRLESIFSPITPHPLCLYRLRDFRRWVVQ